MGLGQGDPTVLHVTVVQLLHVPGQSALLEHTPLVVAHFPLLVGQGALAEQASPDTEQIISEGMQSALVLQNLLGVSWQLGRWQSSSE
jgi:hypothetical protein